MPEVFSDFKANPTPPLGEQHGMFLYVLSHPFLFFSYSTKLDSIAKVEYFLFPATTDLLPP
jgi:hypothetical protein